MTEIEADRSETRVTRQDNALLLQGDFIETYKGEWVAQKFEKKRLVLSPAGEKTGIEEPDAIAGMPILLFTKFLEGLCNSQWSGLVSIDTGYGIKRLYFSKGELVFAGSNLMDDRLGEVIYREAYISLDELTRSAAQVTKARKFGQVLVSSGTMSQIDLWNSLSLQVQQILRSIFMVNRVYFEIQESKVLASTELILRDPTPRLLQSAASYGSVFRAFLGRLTEETEAQILASPEELLSKFPSGTFLGDLISLIGVFPNVQKLLDGSKLMDLYTVATIFQLSNLGIIQLLPELEVVRPRGASFQGIRARLDAYSYVLGGVRRAFQDAGQNFPIESLREFAGNLNPEGWAILSIQSDGELSRECALGIFQQVQDMPERFGLVDRMVESLIQFLLQFTGDSLNFSLATKIRQEYRSVSM
jgi:hypothetical protein